MIKSEKNMILENAKNLIDERLRVDCNNTEIMYQYFSKCYTHLSIVVGELRYQIEEVERLKKEIEEINARAGRMKKEGIYGYQPMYNSNPPKKPPNKP